MEKLKKEKHNHKLTDLLKVLIFSIVMLAPIFSVVSKVMYVALNKNAKDSYYGETINESKSLNTSLENLKPNIMYYGDNNRLSEALQTSQAERYEIIFNEFYYQDTKIDEAYLMYFYGFSSETGYQGIVADSNNNRLYTLNSTTDFNKIRFSIIRLNDISTRNDWLTNNIFVYYEYNKYSYMDNVFPYAVNELQNDTLYNWAKGTFAYTSINAMCSGLSVQNGVLPLLLSYWVIITAIYIVFDIIIFTFTKLTHLLQD